MSGTKSTAIWIGVVALLLISGHFLYPHDDTDPPNGRSGIVPYTDHKTGCQYLKAGSIFSGSLTPRMGTDGKQICATNQAAAQGGKEG
jgi:hypothetical protein